jgi:hypothetical protein
MGDPGHLRIRERVFQAPQVQAAPILRRDPLARVESLTKRLVDAVNQNPALFPMILKEIQGEYWKAGAPVSIEKLREAATTLIQQAEREARINKLI